MFIFIKIFFILSIFIIRIKKIIKKKHKENKEKFIFRVCVLMKIQIQYFYFQIKLLCTSFYYKISTYLLRLDILKFITSTHNAN